MNTIVAYTAFLWYFIVKNEKWRPKEKGEIFIIWKGRMGNVMENRKEMDEVVSSS